MNPDRWRQIEDLFNTALARSPEGRHAFVKKACGDDVELSREVESLLHHERAAASFLETQTDEPAKPSVEATLLGRQIGPYRINALLGSGGMGEVYRAHDTKLDRDVALKVLPSDSEDSPERFARFRLEARALASLNHPNIGAIYGLEESDGVPCLVLELVEGEDLRGPLPVAKALDYATQIACALTAAHSERIVHRDLKPANVRVTAEGRIKVLDFGLATVILGGEKHHISDTSVGQVVGTPAYMSPEQARGRTVDAGTDIWAFGCLLYELLAGQRAFQGATPLETIESVLHSAPDWSALPAKTPPEISELLHRCLEKDRNRRLPTIADARRLLERAGRAPVKTKRWRWAATAAIGGAALAAASMWTLRPARLADRSEWVQLTNVPDPVSQPALSPDGRLLAFVRSASTFLAAGEIYVKKLPDGEPVQLTHDNFTKMNPAFSPDGERIGYTVVDPQFHWDTWIVPASGGEPQLLERSVSDMTWTSPGRILFSQRPRKAIMAAEAGSAEQHGVYFPRNERGIAHRPQASPDGKWVLLAELDGYGDWEPCRVVPIDGSSIGRQVGPPHAGCTSGAWSPDGKWVYLTTKAGGIYHIWRQRFPHGEPEQFTSGPTEEEGIAVAPDGGSIVTAVALQNSSIWIHDERGERQISALEGNAAYPKFSRDGKKLCYRILKAVPRVGTNRDPGELWVADLESGRSEPLAPGFQPVDYDISPDGQEVVMEVPDSEGRPRLWLAPLDRRTPPRQIPNAEGRNAVFAPNGEVLFRRTEGASAFAYRIRRDGTHLRRALDYPLLSVSSISPDGRWLVAWSSLPGSTQVAVQAFSLDGGSPVLVGSNSSLQWSPDGRYLWISGGAIADNRSYVVPLPHGSAFPPIPPQGFRSEEQVAQIPGAQRMDIIGAPGPSPDVYAVQRRTIQRNLYRVPIH